MSLEFLYLPISLVYHYLVILYIPHVFVLKPILSYHISVPPLFWLTFSWYIVLPSFKSFYTFIV